MHYINTIILPSFIISHRMILDDQKNVVLVVELYFPYFFFNKILLTFNVTHMSFRLAQGQDLWRIT